MRWFRFHIQETVKYAHKEPQHQNKIPIENVDVIRTAATMTSKLFVGGDISCQLPLREVSSRQPEHNSAV